MTEDDEIVEAMARALAKERYSHCGGDSGEVLGPGKPNWRFCVPDAWMVRICEDDIPLYAIAETTLKGEG